MKKYIYLILINLILALIQSSLLNMNFLLALAVAFIFVEKNELAYASGFIGGLILDLLSFGIVGKTPLFFVTFLILFTIVRRFVSKNIFVNGAVTILGIMLYDKLLGELSLINSFTLLNVAFTLFSAIIFVSLLFKYEKTSF